MKQEFQFNIEFKDIFVKLRRGVDNLRVCDLSAVPNINSGNTAAVAMMLGFRCGDLINNAMKN